MKSILEWALVSIQYAFQKDMFKISSLLAELTALYQPSCKIINLKYGSLT